MKTSAWLLSFFLVSVSTARPGAAIYDNDPAHAWNRLAVALHTTDPVNFDRPGEYDARTLQGPSYEAARKALDDFLLHDRAKLIADPARHAVLQSELWATFDQVSDATAERRRERDDITRRCAALMKRLALSPADIAALPDTYRSTVAKQRFPVAFQPEHADDPFLPSDLFDEQGPWVMLGAPPARPPEPAAIQHAKATQGRSVFYALIRLPEGRAATVAYLRTLAAFPEPYVANEMHATYPYARAAMKLNPALPQFPAGTQVALVRRMIVIDTRGELVVSPIVESIQIRVYVLDPKVAQIGEHANQRSFDFRLAPADMFARDGGLLRADPETPGDRLFFARANLFTQAPGVCTNCHGGVGVHSLNTYTRAFGELPNTPWFEPSSESWQNRFALDWKKRDYTWGLLSALLQSNQ